MKHLVLCVTLNLLFFINIAYSTVSITPKYTDNNTKSVIFNVDTDFSLQCHIVSTDKSEKIRVKWKIGDKDIENKGIYKISNSNDTYTLTIKEPQATAAGNYSCVAEDDNGQVLEQEVIAVVWKIQVHVPSNLNVAEGETFQIHCQTKGFPPPTLSWSFDNGSTSINISKDVDDRYGFKDDGVNKDAYLEVKRVEMSDRGHYICTGTSTAANDIATSSCMVRVKDKYAALWPFLGICIEVFVLCAIIFIYEKKRNKTELEESDTDQSPDQKNTPDHEKESNLRHRQ